MASSAEYTQWASVAELGGTARVWGWLSGDDLVRINAYGKYEQIYWSDDRAFELMRQGSEQEPIIVPNARTICDTTSHFLLKGLDIKWKGEADTAWKPFAKREKFMARFMVAKHSGVVRGDYVFHITADPEKPEGKRVCFNSVDPAMYFPIYNDDDLDEVVGVHLCYEFKDPADNKLALWRKTYRKEDNGLISVEELVIEPLTSTDKRPWHGDDPPIKRKPTPYTVLPKAITTIPVYHFKNIDWQGQPFGSSELRGFERIIAGVSQTISDEELALALDGLGVYATDAGTPTDSRGQPTDWVVFPGSVQEVPSGSYFRRVEGVKSVAPMLEHVNYLDDRTFEAAGVFRAGLVEAGVAESGIALAIRFLPQAAKIEERELEGRAVLDQMLFDWCAWSDAYEETNIAETEPEITVGDKLPINREERTMELNNMFDRKLISAKFYRSEMEKLGYIFPEGIEDEIAADMERRAKFAISGTIPEPQGDGAVGPDGRPLPSGKPSNPNDPSLPQPGNKSNNAGKANESGGTEAKQTLRRQARA